MGGCKQPVGMIEKNSETPIRSVSGILPERTREDMHGRSLKLDMALVYCSVQTKGRE